jgi:transitional endoplasmic reticulum ATPase
MSSAEKTTIQREAREVAALATRKALADQGDEWAGIDVGIERKGAKIVLPATPVPMDYQTAITTLQRKIEDEEQDIDISESVDAFPKDGAVAFQKAMMEMFGWVSAVPTPGFFGPQPPQTIDVEISHDQRMSVLWGRFEMPGVEGYVECGGHNTPQGPRFRITGEVKRKHHAIVVQLAEITRRIAKTESIYRNKAIKLTVDEGGGIDWYTGLTFSNLTGVVPAELVFSAHTRTQIETLVWTLIEQTDRCRRQQIPLKRGILMEGKYGTGKSLTAAVTALKAVANGWTFLSISRVAGLKAALPFARMFQPCVIFAEDIDSILAGAERTQEIDDVLNTIDGIESKGTAIMVVLTTNHVERMNRAMLRPGRLDAIITITPPDAGAVKQLVRLYGRSMVDQNDPLEQSSEVMSGWIPASIRECTERAKLYAISRSSDDVELQITDHDLYHAALGMQSHIDLLEGQAEEKRDPTFRDIVKDGVTAAVVDLLEIDETVLSAVRNVDSRVRHISEVVDSMGGGRSALVEKIREIIEARRRAA